jgi:hypothetical protein
MRGTARQREVIAEIAAEHGLAPEDLFRRFVRGRIGHARQHLMAALYATGRYSQTQIGNLMGLDHTTVMWGIRCHKLRASQAAEIEARAFEVQRLTHRLEWQRSPEQTRDIITGQHAPTEADVSAWDNLGRAAS